METHIKKHPRRLKEDIEEVVGDEPYATVLKLFASSKGEQIKPGRITHGICQKDKNDAPDENNVKYVFF